VEQPQKGVFEDGRGEELEKNISMEGKETLGGMRPAYGRGGKPVGLLRKKKKKKKKKRG